MPCMVSYHRLKSGHITCYLNRTYHVLLAPGSNSYTVSGIDFDHAKPLSLPPDRTQKGLEHRPGEVEFALIDVTPAPLPATIIPKTGDSIRPEDLHLKLTDEELRALKLRADQRK